MAKTALICGVSGQDGAYLAASLLSKGYRVTGTSRDAQVSTFHNLERLGIKDGVDRDSMTLTDFRSVIQVISRVAPDEIYNLAGQSSVGLSFTQPVETMESIALGALNLLEGVRFLGGKARIYNAASGECFGEAAGGAADEETPFRPRSPYAVAKAAAYWEVANYRDAYGLFACSGILFNHESPLRPERFVTQKVAKAAKRIADGSAEKLELGDLNVMRDWGWAPEYVEAMWLMLQQEVAADYVIATGETRSLEDFVDCVFRRLGLEWRDHVVVNRELFRPSEIRTSRADPSKAARDLMWTATTRLDGVATLMLKHA